MRRDKNYRDRTVTGRQLTLKLNAAHPRHTHIKYQTVRVYKLVRIHELFSRSERADRESDRSDEPPKGLTDGLVIINNRNKSGIGHPKSITGIATALYY